MFKHFSTAVLTFACVLASTSARAATITISDLTDTGVTYTTTSDITGVTAVATAESLILSGTFHIPFGNGVVCNPGSAACDQAFNLTESSGEISDTVHLVFNGTGGPGQTDWEETFTLTFLSDIDGVALVGLPGAISVPETGALQALRINQGGLGGG